MIEFLNTYSALIVALLFGLVTFFEKRSSKIAKRENEERLKEAKEAEANKEKLLEIQRQEQVRKDENLDTTLKTMDGNIKLLNISVGDMRDDLGKLSGDFESFKKDTSEKFITLGESCYLAMKYSRGVASVTLNLDKAMNTGNPSPAGEKLMDLYESQEDYLLEGLLKNTIKK